MHRPPGGKRIRMDDPPPPEYDALTAASPYSTPSSTPYHNPAATPLRSVGNIYPDHFADSERIINPSEGDMQPEPMPMPMLTPMEPMVQENGPEPQPEPQTMPMPIQMPPPLIDEWENGNGAHPEEEDIGRRVTRARARGAAPPPPSVVPNPTPAQIRRALADERPSKKRAPNRRSQGETHKYEDEASLYFIVRQARTSLQNSVDDWIESYKVNRDSALLALMQFFIHASGCKGKITPAMQSSMEHAAIIRKMTEEFEEESGEYPLIMTGQQWKKFRSNFCDFIQILVKQCQYSIIYDQYLMDNLISLLTGLSDSQVRAFRHTATLAAMKLMTALVDVALVVSINLDNTQRQYEAERQKTRDKRAADRLETLMSKRQELEENMDEIKNMLTYMFKSVFVHRYRDTLAEIRAICMAEIGVWMKKFHQNFLDDSYLKYIGWTLHDKVGEVRLKCLQALQPLYSSEELKGKLELFTSKFKDRIVAMTLDKEYDVAVPAVKLVTSILKHHRDILTDKDCEHVYELVYSSHRLVAQAAGEFLNERLFVLDEDINNSIKTRRGKKRLPNTPLIRDLVQFFIESELHEHAAYLVDSLIESNEMMKDWECMTDLLIEEPGPKEEPLDDRQETSLIEIMVCCIRQAATGEPPVGRGPTRKIVPSVKELKQIKDDKEKLTDHFMQTLPPLLEKYGVDSDKLTNLLSIPQYFNLERYTSSRQEGNLDQLLKKMQRIVERTTNNEVLETCAKTLEVLCTEGTAIFTRCDVARSTLIDSVVNRYKEAMDDWRSLIEGEEEPNEEETFQVTTSLKKVSIISSCHNMGNWNVWDSVFHDIQDAKESTHRTLPEEAIKYCFGACFTGLLWDLNSIEDMIESGSPVHHEVDCLKRRQQSFMQLMQEILVMSTEQEYRDEAYVTVCDLLVVFCNQLAQTDPILDELKYEPDDNLQNLLNDFIQTYVFIEDDDEELDEHSKIEELHKRRNFLASYCKLIVYNMLPVSAAGDIFKHYVKYYNEYGDIIKATLGKAREINKVNCARTMLYSLITLFQDEWSRSRTSEEFIGLKELAKRFALSFGLDAVKNRDAITVLHRDGIVFAVSNSEYQEDPSKPPPNLPFLEILSEFTNKLLKQDKRVVLTFLDRRVAAGMPSSRGEDWQPLLLYRNSLVHGETDRPTITSKRAYGRRRKEPAHGEDEIDDELLSDEEFPVGKTTRPRKRPARPNHPVDNASPLDVLARAAGTALRDDVDELPTGSRRRRSRFLPSYEELSDLDIDLMNLEDEDEDDSESGTLVGSTISTANSIQSRKTKSHTNVQNSIEEFRKRRVLNEDLPSAGPSDRSSTIRPRLNVQRVTKLKPYHALERSRAKENRPQRPVRAERYQGCSDSDFQDSNRNYQDNSPRSRSDLDRSREQSEERRNNSSSVSGISTSRISQKKIRRRGRRHTKSTDCSFSSDSDFQDTSRKSLDKNRYTNGRSRNQSEGEKSPSRPVFSWFGTSSLHETKNLQQRRAHKSKQGRSFSSQSAISDQNSRRVRFRETPKPRLDVQIVKHRTSSSLTRRPRVSLLPVVTSERYESDSDFQDTMQNSRGDNHRGRLSSGGRGSTHHSVKRSTTTTKSHPKVKNPFTEFRERQVPSEDSPCARSHSAAVKPRLDVKVVKHNTASSYLPRRSIFYRPLEDSSS